MQGLHSSISRNLRRFSLRALSAILLLFIVTFVSFFILDRLPGNAAQQLLGIGASADQLRALESELGIGRPVLERYLQWLTSATSGDLGLSLASKQSVTQLLLSRMPVTYELVILTLTLALAIALPTALLCARYPNGIIDRGLLFVNMAGMSIPSYVLALLLVLLFSISLRLLPSIGFVSIEAGLWSNIRTLVLPAAALALPLAGVYSRYLRADLLQKLHREEYVLTAVAKGLSPWRILTRHALRNSLPGLLTLVCMNFGVLLGGTVVIEQMFALPGLGALLLQSVTIRDVPVVQGIIFLLGFGTIAASLCSDFLVALLDPRHTMGNSH
jgi:peptide/nickel transport system permease protein